MDPTEGAEPAQRPPRFKSAAFGTFGAQLAIALVSFLNVLIIARALGPEARGDVVLLTTISVLTSTFGLLGIDEANVNIAGREPALRRALATNTVVLSIVLGGACVGILVPLIAVFPALAPSTAPWLLWLALAAIPMLILKLSLKFLLQADYRFRVANAAWLFPPVASAAVNGTLALLGLLSVGTAFAAWVAAHAIATVLLVAFVALRSAGFGRPHRGVAKRALSFGSRSHLGRVMMVGNYRVDQWFVGAMAGSRELGLYSIAVAWAEILFYLPTALVIVQRPYLVRSSRAEASTRAAKVFRGSVILTAIAAIAIVVLAPILCVVVFGADFAGATDDLRVLATGALGILALKLLGNALTSQGRPGLATAGATAAFVVTLALDILLIPSYGGLGAAIASVVAYAVGGVATAIIFLRFFRAPTRSLAPRPSEVPALLRMILKPLSSLRRPVRAP